MNTSLRLSALVLSLAAAGSAFAESPHAVDPMPTVSTLTRAEVQAEVQQARAHGLVVIGEAELSQAQVPSVAVTRDRDAVRAETRAAIASGALPVVYRESNGFAG
jgi:hypothetical protein